MSYRALLPHVSAGVAIVGTPNTATDGAATHLWKMKAYSADGADSHPLQGSGAFVPR